MSNLGKYIEEKRKEKGLSQRALAGAAEISNTEIHRINAKMLLHPYLKP